MRRLVTWLLITLGIAALARKLRSRRESAVAGMAPAAPETAEETADDPAEELRRKLAETRAPSAADEPPSDATVEERRAGVHEQGRAAVDEMRASDEDA